MSGYVDPIAVERAMHGDRIHLTILERRAAVQGLTRRGLSSSAIADLVGISSRTVVRHRSRTGVMVSTYGM